jgi:polyisoprenoid-binding protein YceI
VNIRAAHSGWIWGAGAILLILGWARLAPGCELPAAPNTSGSRLVLRVDGAKSVVSFEAKAFLHGFSGRTSKILGTIRLVAPNRLDGAEACFRIDAASLATGNDTRDAIMRDDHLETRAFPSIALDLMQVKDAGRTADGWTIVARGLLTLHGVARETLLSVRARQDREVVRLTGEVPVKMSDHGIPVPKFLFLTVEDQVLVRFDVTATRVP